MSVKRIICFLSLVVLEIIFVNAQLPPTINIPGAILLPSNRPLPIRPQRLNPDNAQFPVRVRKPIPNVLPISIPIREEPEDDTSLESDEDAGRLNIPSFQQSSPKQSFNDNILLPKPIQFRPERPLPILPVQIRPALKQLEEDPPIFRQAVRQPPQQVQHAAPPPPPQQTRQKVRVVANPKPISQHFNEDERRVKNRKPPVQILRKYRTDNDDGSITWGYENEDGTFKEETIRTDCIISGKYGYIDPEGTRREYTYEAGNKCDPQEDDLPLEEINPKGPVRPSKSGYPIKV